MMFGKRRERFGGKIQAIEWPRSDKLQDGRIFMIAGLRDFRIAGLIG
jgi:hypothetical protein